MPDAPNPAPAFVGPLLSADAKARSSALEQVHPEYAAHKQSWQVLLDAFEGSGGFLDGGYLWAHPAEDDRDYLARKSQARYHDYVGSLIDLYVRFVFTQGVKRASKSDEYNAWLEDVDGSGTPINDFLKRAAAMALAQGHVGILVDRTADAPAGPAKADERSEIFASVYPATAILDWRLSRATISGVKLLEAVPPNAIIDAPREGDDAVQYLLWDTEGWARFDSDGHLIAAGVPNLGLVPLVTLRPKPSIVSPFLGRPLVNNANVVRALFNRASEEDEVIRRQSFSVLTVEVDPEHGDPQAAKEALGSAIGSAKALVVPGKIDYKTPDQDTTRAIRENIAYLVQELFRSAHVRFKRDSLDAESGEAIRLQQTELNEMLQGFAKALATTEQQIARAWFAWAYPTPDAAEAAYEAADVQAEYPDEFFTDALLADLEAWGEAIRLDLGQTMTKRIKKRAVRRIEPDIAPEDLAIIDGEIDAQVEPVVPEVLAVPSELRGMRLEDDGSEPDAA